MPTVVRPDLGPGLPGVADIERDDAEMRFQNRDGVAPSLRDAGPGWVAAPALDPRTQEARREQKNGIAVLTTRHLVVQLAPVDRQYRHRAFSNHLLGRSLSHEEELRGLLDAEHDRRAENRARQCVG